MFEARKAKEMIKGLKQKCTKEGKVCVVNYNDVSVSVNLTDMFGYRKRTEFIVIHNLPIEASTYIGERLNFLHGAVGSLKIHGISVDYYTRKIDDEETILKIKETALPFLKELEVFPEEFYFVYLSEEGRDFPFNKKDYSFEDDIKHLTKSMSGFPINDCVLH